MPENLSPPKRKAFVCQNEELFSPPISNRLLVMVRSQTASGWAEVAIGLPKSPTYSGAPHITYLYEVLPSKKTRRAIPPSLSLLSPLTFTYTLFFKALLQIYFHNRLQPSQPTSANAAFPWPSLTDLLPSHCFVPNPLCQKSPPFSIRNALSSPPASFPSPDMSWVLQRNAAGVRARRVELLTAPHSFQSLLSVFRIQHQFIFQDPVWLSFFW